MAGEAAHGVDLIPVVSLLAAGVLAVPIFRRVGLGSILGYLAAGLVVGPYGFGVIDDTQTTLHVAELGVVMFLFVIGLEMQPSRLWGLRREIFGLGLLQFGACAGLLTLVGVATGFPVAASFVAGAGFVLTSTAIVMQVLNERGLMATQRGQRMISILLLEDLAIVPLLAVVAFLGPVVPGEIATVEERVIDVATGVASIVALVVAGRYLLNPIFRLLAESHAREVMTAAALLIVLGAALMMQVGGLSMAMGAFLAGVLLSESTFRHQLEADIEPFRGILLGLFFLAVGMSLDLAVVADNWAMVAFYVVAYMLVKSAGIYAVARALGHRHNEAIERAVMMAQGGEFAFVLYSAAATETIISGQENSILTAIVILSMVLTPFALMGLRFLTTRDAENMDGIDVADGLEASVLVIGFGRFGQIATQPLLLRDHDVTIIDNDVEMIRVAGDFGFKVYYGDGTRSDILHAAGAGRARAVMICVDKGEQAVEIARHMRSEYPLVPVLARAYDRGTALRLIELGVDFQLRETFESAVAFGAQALRVFGTDEETIAATLEDLRERDTARLEMQVAGDILSGNTLLKGNSPVPAPLAQPRRKGKALNEEAAEAIAKKDAEDA